MSKKPFNTLLLLGWATGALFYAFDFLVRASTNAVSAPLIHTLGLNATSISVIGSVFYWFYVAAQMPAGIAVDKFGVKRIMMFATFVLALGTALFSMGHDVYTLSAARALMGFAGGFAFVSVLKLASDYFPVRFFPLFAGFTQLLGYTGAALSGTPLAAVITNDNWRHIFLMMALIGLVIFVMTIFFVKGAKWQHEHEKKRAQEIPLSTILKQMLRLSVKPQLLLNGLYCTFMMGATSVFSALWGINYLMTVKGLPEHVAATACSTVFIGVAVASPVWGVIATWMHSNKKPLVIAAILAAINSLFLLYFDIGIAGLMFTSFMFGAFQSAHVLNFTTVRNYVDKQFIGSAIALLNMFTAGGGALLQPLAGIFIDLTHRLHLESGGYTSEDYQMGLLLIPVVQLLSFAISLFLVDRKHK